MGIEFVECGHDDVDAVQAFFGKVYRPDYPLATNGPLFRWQFGQRTGRSTYCCKLARLDDEIVGCLGYVPVEVSVGTAVCRGAWTANWVVDLTQRRLGIGPLLMRELTRQFDVTLAVGLSRDSREILPRMGWTDFGDLARYVNVLDPEAAGALAVDGRIEWPISGPRQPNESDRATSVHGVRRFADGALSVWDRNSGDRAGTRRSPEFLNWRYADHPVFEYRLFEAYRHGDVKGLAVYRVERVRDVPLEVGRIVEFLAESDAAGALIDAVMDDARAHQVVAMDFFCSRVDAAPLLQRGFLPGDEDAAARIPVLFQPIDRRRSGIPFMAYMNKLGDHRGALKWYVTKGDGDQDRPN